MAELKEAHVSEVSNLKTSIEQLQTKLDDVAEDMENIESVRIIVSGSDRLPVVERFSASLLTTGTQDGS